MVAIERMVNMKTKFFILIFLIFFSVFSGFSVSYASETEGVLVHQTEGITIPYMVESGSTIKFEWSASRTYAVYQPYVNGNLVTYTLGEQKREILTYKPSSTINQITITSIGDKTAKNFLYEVWVDDVSIWTASKGYVPPPEPDETPPDNVTGMTYTSTDTSITVSWTNPLDADLAHHEIYFDDSLIKSDVSKDETSYTFSNLLPDTSHLIKIVSYDSWGNKSNGASISASTLADMSKIPPANVTNLIETHTDKTVTLKWTNPSDSDLAGFKIYRNGSLIATKGVVTSFVDSDLVSDTSYSYKVVSYDVHGNDSAGSLINVKTNSDKDLIPPDAPTGLKLSSMNSGIYVSWDKNKELDLDGYNVFVNGVKYNTNLLRGTTLVIEGLENEKEYQIQVTAVDTSQNESEKSYEKTVAPSSHAMPSKMKMSYSLADVANGISSWFDSLWLVLAFAIGIPLSFYVASRVKLLFLS
jgi:chitodextrinase